jgi:hypothetical protein
MEKDEKEESVIVNASLEELGILAAKSVQFCMYYIQQVLKSEDGPEKVVMKAATMQPVYRALDGYTFTQKVMAALTLLASCGFAIEEALEDTAAKHLETCEDCQQQAALAAEWQDPLPDPDSSYWKL